MLQDLLMAKLIDNTALGQKIQRTDSVNVKGKYALDAIEKNPNVEGTLAETVQNNSDKIGRVQTSINAIISLPDGASTAADGEIAAAKVGPKGESYSTLQEAITKQIEDYKGVSVSNTQPSVDSEVDVWVNTDSNETAKSSFNIPQIDDTILSTEDTWSSNKINGVVSNLEDAIRGYIANGTFPEPSNPGSGGSTGGTGGGSISGDYIVATESSNGLMSSSDKKKLNNIQENANNYTHPTYATAKSGLYKITVDAYGHVSKLSEVVKEDIMGLGIPGQDTNTTYADATKYEHGLMSVEDKKKLDSEQWLSPQTLNAGSLELIVQSTEIKTDSLLDIYYNITEDLEVSYTQVDGSLTITLETALDTDLIARIKVINFN